MYWRKYILLVAFLTLTTMDTRTLGSPQTQGRVQVYDIKTTWNNVSLPPEETITLSLSTSIEFPSNEYQLVIGVTAPFFNDPIIPDDTPDETMWELWEYEVVELFLLGSDDHYLEIELSPKGQYLLLELKGYRKVIRDKMPLYKANYVAEIDPTTRRWSGRAVIPNCYLPPNVQKFNAYAIHGTNPNRVYKSLFPVSQDDFEDPDFHRLEYFEPIDFKSLFPSDPEPETSSPPAEPKPTQSQTASPTRDNPDNNGALKSPGINLALLIFFVISGITFAMF